LCKALPELFFNPINIGTYDFWKLSRKA